MELNLFKFLVILFVMTILFSCKKGGVNDNIPETNVEIYDYSDKKLEDFINRYNDNLIIVNYWATFCSPCKKEIPDFVKLVDEYKNKGVLFIGASVDKSNNAALVEKLAKLLKVNYPIVYGVEPGFRGEELAGLPTTYFLDKDRKVLEAISGKRDYGFLKERIEKYISRNSNGNNNIDGMVEKEFYTLKAEVIESQDKNIKVKIVLSPGENYKINGEGYPPFDITFNSTQDYEISPEKISAAGVDTGKDFIKIIEIKYMQDVPLRITGKVNLLVCDDSTCNIVEESFSLKS